MKNLNSRLEEVLLLLASDYEIQISSFPDYVCVPDEIAMETEDVFSLIKNEIVIDNFIASSLETILKKFDDMSENPDEWTLEALKEYSSWNCIREIANGILIEYKIFYRRPNLFWINYETCNNNINI